MTSPLRGEVWWVERPYAKRRPCLIMTRSAAIPRLEQIVVVPVTRTIRGIPSELRLGPEDGMRSECVASFDNLSRMFQAYLVQRICTLGPERMAEACAALRAAVDC